MLLGSWPAETAGAPIPIEAPAALVTRFQAQMFKAIKEAKTHTSWLNQNHAYEDAVSRFVSSTLTGPSAARFLEAFAPFARRIARAGMVNSLAQLLLKIASPGIPDFYQGTEVWQLDMADPDNRRAIDFHCRVVMLDALMPWILRAESCDRNVDEKDVAEREAFLRQLLANWLDGRLKMFLTACALRFRRREAALFLRGEYTPLRAEGADANRVVAFARREGEKAAVVVVPRLASDKVLAHPGSSDPGEEWGETCVVLPADLAGGPFVNLYSGAHLRAVDAHLPASAVFRACPVALLVAER
jgi:(1->4)-alpha-D-glucan 1-alpha-D-glucosylmutase